MTARSIIVSATLSLILASSLTAEPSETKSRRELIGEVMSTMDTEALTRAVLELMIRENVQRDQQQVAAYTERLEGDERRNFEERRSAVDRQQAEFHQRLMQRIDYDRFSDEVYYPIINKAFNDAELKELLGFIKTRAGQKTMGILAELSAGALFRGGRMLEEGATSVQQEIESEERAKTPKWKSTMADMRALATAVESYSVDNDTYPVTGDLSKLAELIAPTYILRVPQRDGWGNSFSYVSSSDGRHYRIASAGADGVFEWESRSIDNPGSDARPRAGANSNADIIYQDGTFIRYPPETGD